MNSLKKFQKKTLKYDFINKFFYENTCKLPEIKKVFLTVNCKNTDFKKLATSLLALSIVANQKICVIRNKNPNLFLKVRKGQPTGCKVELSKKNKDGFLSRIFFELPTKFKNFTGLRCDSISINMISFIIKDIFAFYELENHYHIFNKLENLNVTLITNSKQSKETYWIFKSIKAPILQKNF
jgi:ribosomal protein L5